jgi:hypothetical protein
MLAVPGQDYQIFLDQLDQRSLALIRCRWDQQGQKFIPVGRVPQVFLHPELVLKTSLAIQNPGSLPITRWDDVPSEVTRQLGWEPGQQVPVDRKQYNDLETWLSYLTSLPAWYAASEYRSLVSMNLCFAQAHQNWGEDCFWVPLLNRFSEV